MENSELNPRKLNLEWELETTFSDDFVIRKKNACFMSFGERLNVGGRLYKGDFISVLNC